jgi:hypothetical protein
MKACAENEITEILTPNNSGNERTTERTNHGIIIRNDTRRNFIRRWEMNFRKDDKNEIKNDVHKSWRV